MHPSFMLPEILGEICLNLHWSWDRSALAALARTCRAFHDPALDVLWQEQTLDTLLRCLPADLLVEENAMRLLRPILVEDWDRVSLHAHHIRNLHCADLTSVDILPMIAQSLPAGLFPKLAGLSCGAFHFSFMMCQLLSPTLRKLEMDFWIEIARPAALFTTLAHRCPWLTEFTVEGGWDNWREISVFVLGLHCLESVDLHSLHWDTLSVLGRLPSLRSLELDFLPITLPARSNSSMFLVLANLKLGSTPIQSTTHLLSTFRETPLVSLHVTPKTTPAASEWHALFSNLVSGCSHPSLETLQMDSWDVDTSGVVDYLVPERTVQLLFCFVNLRQVCIESGVGFDLDDNTVSDMACAWPRLVLLRLVASAGNVRSRVTLRGLRAFAQHCPRLESLEMVFDASAVTSTESVSGHIASNHNLRTLFTHHCPITAPLPVSHFLSEMFPRLTSIQTKRTGWEDDYTDDLEDYFPETIGYREIWKEVDALLAPKE
ncbi:hypothetical protein C8R43DRAFT_882023 [Mycena crocata]|nr:hypothetical protein C8R43DRAFT_882023 [Mycena crocata]